MSSAAQPVRRHRCSCDHELQLFGGGRHRRYYELDDVDWKQPLMIKTCPKCARRLPGS
jgi:hypothetical protein